MKSVDRCSKGRYRTRPPTVARSTSASRKPTRLSGTQHTEAQYPGAESPQTWDVSFDPLSGIRAGQLERCRRTHTCPKITHTNTDTEWWQADMSLNTTDSFGRHDVSIPHEVRIYQLSGTQHGGGNPLQQPPAVLPAVPNACQLRSNSNPFLHAQRALLVALRDWVVQRNEASREHSTRQLVVAAW